LLTSALTVSIGGSIEVDTKEEIPFGNGPARQGSLVQQWLTACQPAVDLSLPTKPVIKVPLAV
jgi:hypothetical protein